MQLVDYRHTFTPAITQEEMGARLQPPVNGSTISRYEAGRIPSFAVIRQIRIATGGAVTVSDWADLFERKIRPAKEAAHGSERAA